MDTQPLWRPSQERIDNSNLKSFMQAVADRWDARVDGYDALWRWSVDEMEKFWLSIWDYGEVRAAEKGERVLADGDRMPGAKFFPDARLNYAENLLRRRDGTTAIVFRGEDRVKRELTWADLWDAVSRLAQAFRADGLEPGDRVAAYMPNVPETVIAMLAATSIGAVFTSASPDFGVRGVLDRFGQVEPKILLSADGYFYNGKTFDSLDKLPEIARGMPSVRRVIVVPYTSEAPDVSAIPNAKTLPDYVAGIAPGEIEFTQRAFNDPLYILYSSGTTGAPKCIVHGTGAAVLTHIKEHRLMCDVKPGDRVFWFTTCGWMMWNWLVGALASEATLILYDGSPFYPDGNAVWSYADETGMTLFGTSAKYIDACSKAGIEPKKTHDLSTVRTLGSTGSVLVPEGFDYVYDKVQTDIHLASVSGGTDLFGCFVGGNPLGPVWRGELQAPCLAMAMDVFDDDGNSLPPGEQGELVCTRPFPTMPLGFWNDDDGAKYRAAYYERFPNVWCHGDWVQWTEHGGMMFFGRSDATLNPGGVRIGTAEIYRQVEQLDEILESLVIGQDWDGDTRVVLFVVLRDGLTLDDELSARIRKQIRDNATPRHVPARIVQVPDIPRTKSNKIVELAVRNVVHGRPVKNVDALANPEALKHFENRGELAE
ncbi:MAG: acetoacetate--CoA ligase [Bauldia litoralis]